MTANLERFVAAFAADPGDQQAFRALEEAYFVAGDWDKLVALYEQRLRDPQLEDPRVRAPLHFRLGQILEERRLDVDLAVRQYTEAIRLDSTYGPALRQLRQVHANREAWDLVLQIAELEITTVTEAWERASFFAEMGDVWLRRLQDDGEALTCFEQALAIDPEHKDALAGLARTLEAKGETEAAAATWERLVGCTRGPDRATPLVSLANLLAGPLRQQERAVELYRRALADDPRNEVAVEALSVTAAERGQWELLSDLFERRFSLAAGARRRTAIALEAGYVQLEQLQNLDAAAIWFDRAEELAGDEPTVLAARVDLDRERGDEERLVASLTRLLRALGADTPLRHLLEAAGIFTERADDEQALRCLELAQQSLPNDPLVLESLGHTYANLQRHDEAAGILERRAALCADEPDEHAGLLIELGYVHATHLGDIPAAQDAYERAFTAAPSRPGLATTLEALYRKTESWQELHTLLQRAVDSGPEEERAGFLCSLGELLEERFERPDESAACYEACLDRGADARALRGLSRLAARSGDPGAMRRALEREASMVTDPERLAVVWKDLSERCEQAGELDAALDWAERLLGQEPDAKPVLERVAELQEALGRGDDLARTLTRLDEALRGPEQTEVRCRIAALHEATDDTDAAVQWWEAALETAPDEPRALAALDRHYTELARFEDLAKVLRRRADANAEPDVTAHLDRLASLLDDRLGDLDGAIVVLWRLAHAKDRPDDADERLEHALERAGRYEELAQHLLDRRRALDDGTPEALSLDLRRAELLLDPLCQFEEAARTFRSVRLTAPGEERAIRGLERALREGNDSTGLARLLGELAESADSDERREQLGLERAMLLEDALGELEQARQGYTALCDDPRTGAETAREAIARLENLLERCGDWEALRARLEQRTDAGEPEDRIALHERIARLCLDRMSDPRGASEHLEAAAAVDPNRPEPWRMLAELYATMGRDADQLRAVEAELATDPDPERDRVLHARAADLCLATEQADRAGEHYERLLALDPGRVDATDFLVERYEESGRYADVVRLLEARLAVVGTREEEELRFGLQTALRLRIATLRDEELGDPAGAITVLEAALETDGPEGPATERLGDLYEAEGRDEDLASLCRAAADAAAATGERCLWLLRLGETLRRAGRDEQAIEAYQDVQRERPDDETAHEALRSLYRKCGHGAALVELLERDLPALPIEDEVAVRLEIAEIQESQLQQREEALAQLQRVLELRSEHRVAFERALELARELGFAPVESGLLETRLERDLPADERAELLERKADLLAGPLDAPEASLPLYHEVLALDPARHGARRALRLSLEALGRWRAVLDCLHVEAEEAERDERAAIYERAAEIAAAHVAPDASLPWLERLRGERPQDALILARIADVHRQAGRYESVLRAIDDEIAITSDPYRTRDLHVGRARILERDMQAPGQAIAALERAREIAPDDPEVLAKLDQLYDATDRPRERAGVLELRVRGAAGAEGAILHLAAAELYGGALTEPERAIPHLLWTVEATGANRGGRRSTVSSTPAARGALLGDLADTLLQTGQPEAASRAREAELQWLTSELKGQPAESTDDPRLLRRDALHAELGSLNATALANPTRALHHLRALMAIAEEDGTELAPEAFDRAEQLLVDLLRREGDWIELEERMTRRVGRLGGSLAEWLELARVRDEQLRLPSAAQDAYAQALSQDPHSLPAIRGLRSTAERLGDWDALTSALESERGLPEDLAPDGRAERGALSRRLGDVAVRYLQDEARAREAYLDALDADPNDVVALRSLQPLYERGEEYARAAELYEREARAASSEEESRAAWRAAARMRLRDEDDPAALAAFEEAARLGTLDPDELRTQAELYLRGDDLPRHAETFGTWCDDPDAEAGAADHLTLVEVLIRLERPTEATHRCKRCLEIDPDCAEAWQQLAQLHESGERWADAADAWEESASRRQGADAAEHFRAAALLVEETEPRSCARRLRRATERDPAAFAALADLARVAFVEGELEESEIAASRALDLSAAAGDDGLVPERALETALVGGRAARALERLESAVLFFGAALDLDAQNLEALEAYGALLFERGDLAAARGAIEARLERDPDERHAERLAMLGSILELAGDLGDAEQRFREAVDADPSCQPAYAGLARLCEKSQDDRGAVEALARWAEACRIAGDLSGAAARELRAAELELAGGHLDRARLRLHAALATDPERPRTWVLLAEVEADQERSEEILRLVPGALTHESVTDSRDATARLALLFARAAEQRGAAVPAAEAYALAVENDVRLAEAALGQARLLRATGAWDEAADALRAFCERHPDPDHRDLAEVHYKLARLLAGPLENVDAAILCFERAIEIAPDHTRAREPLASLLGVIPERWRQAVTQHLALLDDDPTRVSSLRSLIEIAHREGREEAARTGLAILRAMGAASAEEHGDAPGRLSRPLVASPVLLDEADDAARRLLQHAGETLAQVLEIPQPEDGEPSDFLSRCERALRELATPGLDGLSDEELGGLITVLAHLALGESLNGSAAGALEPELLDGLDRHLGRWTRRKMRRVLEETDRDAVLAIDPGRWRASMRALASAVAVDLAQGDLETALRQLCDVGTEETGDWSTRLKGAPDALALLRRVLSDWRRELQAD